MTSRLIAPARGPSRAIGVSVALALIVSVFGLLRPTHGASAAESAPERNIAGMIGPKRVTEADVVAANPADFERLQNDYERELHQVEMKFAKSRHDLLQQDLDQLLDRTALEMEAKSRGVGTDQVLADLKSVVPTEEEIHAFYEANKGRVQQPYESVAAKIREYLAGQDKLAATRRFYDDLRAQHGIGSTLAPYRVAVAASGPVRGQSAAPVTIVEFGDFQCPYCKQAESSLRTIMSRYPQQVRLVFRNFPLTQLHPDAQVAAVAAICADRQGKFWQMHDAMYDDQKALKPDALKSTARRLGLDGDRFSACLADRSAGQSLDIDAKAALDLGLDGTPYFFINGRPVSGNVPLEKFESVIADELQRAAHDRG